MRHIGLRNNIALILVTLLTAAMVLIDFVVIVTVHRLLIRHEIMETHDDIAVIQKRHADAARNLPVTAYFKANFQLAVGYDGACMLVCDGDECGAPEGFENCPVSGRLRALVMESAQTGKQRDMFYGALWHVFSEKKPELLVAAPLKEDGKIVGGVGVALRPGWVYTVLTQLQRIILIYIFINVVVFAVAGALLLVKITVNPLNRLLKRAEDYSEDETIFAFNEKQNEFNQLSQSLNRMLQRISSDKGKLRHTVKSLEQANQDLKKAQEEIIRAEKLASAGRLSSGIAHEIGNPISIVLGYLELLQRNDLSTGERADFIARSQKEINRVNKIIQQLLNFSRPSDGALRKIDVHEIIEDVRNILEDHPLLSHVDFSLALGSGKTAVYGDPDKLRQVFLNLIMNASDAISMTDSGEKGKIQITSETIAGNETGNLLKIQFIDNGAGIPGDVMDNIFDPFFTTKAPGKGTGLGLSVSYMIIEAMGGKMTAESEAGKGAAITLTLPLLQEESA